MRILITGMTGVSLPPPYVGIPKTTLFVARKWRELGNTIAVSFIYKNPAADDLGAKAEYFFEYGKEPKQSDKAIFLIKNFFSNPLLYARMLKSYYSITGIIDKELVINSAYGVFIDRVIAKFKPQIILSEAATVKSFMVAQAAKWRGIPVAFDTYAEVHSSSKINRSLTGSRRDDYWNKFLALADLIIAPSQYCANGPLAYSGPDKVKIIFHGIDLSVFKDCDKISRQEAREYFKLPQDLFFVLSVGALTERKGHDHLIEACGSLLSKKKNIGLALCGPGSQQSWKWLAAKHGMSGNIYFFSGLSEAELVKLYRACDLYCDASNSDRACLGMSLTEAMAAQLPVIAYDNGGLPEVVKDGYNGVISPMNDIPKLADKIEEISAMTPEERAAMGRNGEIFAKENVDLNVTAALKLDALKDSLQKRKL